MTKQSTSVSEVLDQLDPEEMNSRIAELREQISVLENEIASIETLLKAVRIRREGKPPRKTRADKGGEKNGRKALSPAVNVKTVSNLPPVERVLLFLEVNGDSTGRQIRANCDIETSQFDSVMRDQRIMKLPSGLYSLRR